MARSNPEVNSTIICSGEKAGVVTSEEFIVNGPAEPPLQDLTTGKLLQQQLDRHPEKLAAVSRWQKASLTYQSLFDSSRDIAQSLLAHGVRPSDRVVILAGNSIEYLQIFFAVGGIGAVFTIVNPTFTAEEVISMVDFTGMVGLSHVKHGYRSGRANSDMSQAPKQFSLRTELAIAITKTY